MTLINKIAGLKFDTQIKDPIIENAETIEIMELAKDGLNKISKSKQAKIDLTESWQNARKKVDMGRDLYEGYDPLSFETKARIDMIYYDQLLQKLDESQDAESVLSSLYKTVKDIYEHINIKPEVYGKKIDYQFLNESIAEQKRIISNVIYEYINTNFYKLNQEDRKEKYLSEATEFAKELIKDGTSPEDALKHSIKAAVMEGFISRIAFPTSIQYRIKYLMEDKEYAKVFDQEKLITLWESFNQKIKNVSRFVSAAI